MSTLPAAQVPLWAPLYGASPVDAVRRFFTKYARFSGRASRSEYWWWALANGVVLLVLYVLTLVGLYAGVTTDASGTRTGLGPVWGIGALCGVLLAVWFLGTLVPSIALTVRRFHDANFSGLFVLLGLIPYVGGLITFVFSVLPSNPMGRRFDAPNGVPVWQSGMPYGAFPPAPGEPDRTAPWQAAAPFGASPYGGQQYGGPNYGAPQTYGPAVTPPAAPGPESPAARPASSEWDPPAGS